MTKRFEGQHGTYVMSSAEPVVLGRLSILFAARSERTGEEVLIKEFREGADEAGSLQSLGREIDALRRLRHPHILEIIDFNLGAVAETSPFLVLPWCRGGDLNQFRRGSDFFPLERVIGSLRQIADAIDFAHANGVIHGDIKPGNILFSQDGAAVFLSDFGMAKYFDVTDRVRRSDEFVVGRARAAQGGGTVPGGTSAYLSPEQLLDNRQGTGSDIYSFGLVAYELFTGQLPFDVRAPLYRQLHARVSGKLIDPVDANPSLSATVRTALKSALAVDPADRPASATNFCDMLVGAADKIKPTRRSEEGSPPESGWWSSLEPAGRAGIIIAIVTAIAGTIAAVIGISPQLMRK